MDNHPKIFIVLPLLREFHNLDGLLRCLQKQTKSDFKLLVCVNQYESWWGRKEKLAWCLDNQRSIEYLQSYNGLDIEVIDKSTKGKGWTEKKGGVGWARKLVMDNANENARPNDIIVSIDADTHYPKNYLEAILDCFDQNPAITGLSLPYYHKATDSETAPFILRYEIYLRNYLLNLLRINSPYAFTALGSAIALPVWAYRKIGGITPVISGEDFYFLQKLAKTGQVAIWADTMAYPSSRFSDRVLFGTGPALIKGARQDWTSYPVYPDHLFDMVKETYDCFPVLFHKAVKTPMDSFLQEKFKQKDIWSGIRNNYRDIHNFTKACQVKVDGLRILQFLKQRFSEFSDVDPSDSNEKYNNRIGSETDQQILDRLNIKREQLFMEEQVLRKEKRLTGIQ